MSLSDNLAFSPSFLTFTILQLVKLKLRNIKTCPNVMWIVIGKMKSRTFLFPILYSHWNTYTSFNSQQDSMRIPRGVPIKGMMKVLWKEKRWNSAFSPLTKSVILKFQNTLKPPRISLKGKFLGATLTILIQSIWNETQEVIYPTRSPAGSL